MSIKVLKHGNKIAVRNPVTGEEEVLINVVFVEEGRSGGDANMSETSQFLSQITGEEVGLNQLRIHTHPVLAKKIGLFPVDSEFPGHINRGLFSTPQLQQQVGRPARLVDGKPTYFKTWISEKPEDDVDQRIDNDVLMSKAPDMLFDAQIGATRVRVLEQVAVPASLPERIIENQAGTQNSGGKPEVVSRNNS